MATDDNDSKWGTIFLDSKRESTLSKLDAMQAASRQEQWNQRTKQDYLEKVRAKAIDRARLILGEAYTERQKIIEEAEAEAASIRNEAKAIQASAESIRNEAQDLRHEVQGELDRAKHTHNTAQEDGFQAGLEQAQEELEKFRHTMGLAVAGVLKAIEKQSLNVFAHWRGELVSLLKVCVEKGTALALDERYNKILEQLVIEAVRNLDDRRHITLRVHPDDEAVMADIFSAAKEKMPDLGQWEIQPDENLELGGLLAESSSGSVDSRLELFREMVENILEHLALPESTIDEAGVEFAKEISRLEMENLSHLAKVKSATSEPKVADVEAHIEADNTALPEEQNLNIDDISPPQELQNANMSEHNNVAAQESIQEVDLNASQHVDATPNIAQVNTKAQVQQAMPAQDELADATALVEDVLLPNDLPSDVHDNISSELSSDLPGDLASDMPNDLPNDMFDELQDETTDDLPATQATGAVTFGSSDNSSHNMQNTSNQSQRLQALEEELLPLPQDDLEASKP